MLENMLLSTTFLPSFLGTKLQLKEVAVKSWTVVPMITYSYTTPIMVVLGCLVSILLAISPYSFFSYFEFTIMSVLYEHVDWYSWRLYILCLIFYAFFMVLFYSLFYYVFPGMPTSPYLYANDLINVLNKKHASGTYNSLVHQIVSYDLEISQVI